ncbi:MAG: DUF2914 domain-containing protein, partial [Gemmatimonadaceae bacterium]
MTAVRLPRPATLATVLVLLAVAVVAFPRETYGQVGGRVLNPNGVTPTASRVLVTMKGPEGESTRPVVAGRFAFPELPQGTRVTLQAMAQGLISTPVTATAPDTMVVLVLRAARADEKFDIVPQGAQRPKPAPAADTPAAAAPAQPADAQPAPAAAPSAPSTPTTPSTPSPTGAANAAPNAQGLSVQDALFTTAELVNREPASVSGCTAAACATRFPSTVGIITFWTRLTGGSPGRWVEHVWLWEGEEIARVRQKVEASSWRTWTRKRIQPDWDGEWRVEVRAEDGTLLA